MELPNSLCQDLIESWCVEVALISQRLSGAAFSATFKNGVTQLDKLGMQCLCAKAAHVGNAIELV